jgi:hypothetical protein
MTLFKTLAMVGLVGVGMIDGGLSKEAKDSDSVTNPVVSSEWKMDGWESTQKPEEAYFTVVVSYSVFELIKDSDTHYFKKAWANVQKFSDGSTLKTGGSGYGSGTFRIREGGDIVCNGSANVHPSNEGLKVILYLNWGGKKSGELKREFLVPWSELEKTVKDEECEIHVNVTYRKPSKPTPR